MAQRLAHCYRSAEPTIVILRTIAIVSGVIFFLKRRGATTLVKLCRQIKENSRVGKSFFKSFSIGKRFKRRARLSRGCGYIKVALKLAIFAWSTSFGFRFTKVVF